MTIPEIQKRLNEIADMIHVLSDELSRRRSVRPRAPNTSTHMTPALRRKIMRYAEQNPKTPIAKIALVFDVNPGRVSEVILGKLKGNSFRCSTGSENGGTRDSAP